MAKAAKAAKEKMVVPFEHQLIREIEAMVLIGTFPQTDIEELKVLSPYDLWSSFYNLCEGTEKQLTDFTIELANKCFDLKEEYEKEMKGLVNGDDVVIPQKKEKKGAAKKKEVPAPAPVAEKKVEPKKKPAVDAPKKKEVVVAPIPKVSEKKVSAKKPVQQELPIAKVTAKPKHVPVIAKRRVSTVPRPKDKFGFKQGTTVSLAAELMTGELTLSQIAKKMGVEQNLYYVVNRLRGKGHTVRFKESMVTAVAAKRKKAV